MIRREFLKVVLPIVIAAAVAISSLTADPEANPPLHQNYGEFGTRILYPDTNLNRSVIVAPAELRETAEEFAGKLRQSTGTEIRVVKAEEAGENLWEENVILFGLFGTNPLIDRLYKWQLTPVDGSFPKDGEFLLHVIADPFGKSANAVVIGSSDTAGAAAGAEELLSRLNREKGVLPFTISANADYPARRFARGAFLRNDAHLQTLRAPNVRGESLLNVLRDVERLGQGYAFTGDAEFEAAIAELLPEFARAVNRIGETASASLHGWSPLLHTTWRLLEPSPLFSEADRAEIARCYHRLIEWDMSQSYVSNFAKNYRDGTLPELRRNKYIFSAFGIYLGKAYFELFFPNVPEIERWTELTETMFGRVTSLMSQDDSTDYFFHVPVTLMRYGFAAGEEKIIEEAVRMARLQSLFVDSLGNNTSVGDGGQYGNSSALYWGHSAILRAAAHHSGDSFFTGVLEKVKNNQSGITTRDLENPLFMFTTSAPGKLPDTAAGIEFFPIDEAYYRDILNPGSEMYVERVRFGELNVPIEKSFYKMVWREGWGEEDQYMMLDGVNGAIHEHADGNTINSLVDRGRIWLADRSGIEKSEPFHNGLVISKDGKPDNKPYLASLDLLADLPEASITRTSLNNYSGANWERTVFWSKGRYFLVRDDVSYLEEGDYLLQNYWQVLGESELKEDRLVARQQDRSFALISLNGGSLHLENRPDYAANMWGKYPYFKADTPPALAHFRQVKTGPKEAGDRDSFVNLLIASDDPSEPDVAVRRLSDQLMLVALDGEIEAIGIEGVATGNLRIEADAFSLTARRLTFAGLRSLRLADTSLTFADPVSLELDVATGRIVAADDTSAIPSAGIGRNFQRDYTDAFWKLVGQNENPHPANDGSFPDSSSAVQSDEWGKAENGLRAAITVTDGERNSPILITGGASGMLEAFDRNGRSLWKREIETGIQDLAEFTVRGSAVIAVAGADSSVRTFSLNGEEMWTRQLPEPSRAQSLVGVTKLKPAKTADGATQLLAATAYREVYRLDENGDISSQMSGYFWGANDLAVVDSADGGEKAVVALEWTHIQREEGRQLKSITRSPGWNWTRLAVAENSNGSPLIIGGAANGWLELIGEQRRDGWNTRLAGGIRALAIATGSGEPRILAGTGGFYLYAFSLAGDPLWQIRLSDRVDQILPVSGGRILVACSDGIVALAGPNGELLAKTKLPNAPVKRLLPIPGSGEIVAATETGQLWRIRIAD